MSPKVISCLDRDEGVKMILSDKTDVAIYNEWQSGVTLIVMRLNYVPPDTVQLLPDFRKIGELMNVSGKKVDWFTVNRTKEEVLKAFEV